MQLAAVAQVRVCLSVVYMFISFLCIRDKRVETQPQLQPRKGPAKRLLRTVHRDHGVGMYLCSMGSGADSPGLQSIEISHRVQQNQHSLPSYPAYLSRMSHVRDHRHSNRRF